MRGLAIATLVSIMSGAACSTADAPEASSSVNAADSTVTGQPGPTSHDSQRRGRATPPQTEKYGARKVSARVDPGSGAPEYREVTLPAGTALPLKLDSAVASDTSQVEDLVRATLRQGVTVNGEAVLPPGTEVRGRVIDVERSGRVKGRARVALRFTMLAYEGDEYDVRSEAIERVADATKAKDAAKIGIGAGAGAAVGAILGGGDGAAKGAAIGAAAGTGTVLATRGDEVRLGVGEPLVTHLTSPLQVRVRMP
jgi:hypothetical protein